MTLHLGIVALYKHALLSLLSDYPASEALSHLDGEKAKAFAAVSAEGAEAIRLVKQEISEGTRLTA